MALEPKKHCPSCKKDLAISEFRKNRAKKDGLSGYCKKCGKELQLILRRFRGQLTAQSAQRRRRKLEKRISLGTDLVETLESIHDYFDDRQLATEFVRSMYD